jgi:hypothetical protein
VFGRLTVLHPAQESGPVRKWVCSCECGTARAIATHALIKGLTQSCGCLRREEARKRRVIDRTGHTFGTWKVLGLDGERIPYRNYVVWRCECIRCGWSQRLAASRLKENAPCSKCSARMAEKERDDAFVGSLVHNRVGVRITHDGNTRHYVVHCLNCHSVYATKKATKKGTTKGTCQLCKQNRLPPARGEMFGKFQVLHYEGRSPGTNARRYRIRCTGCGKETVNNISDIRNDRLPTHCCARSKDAA